MATCPVCRQEWHDLERFRLLGRVAVSARGAVVLSIRQAEMIGFLLAHGPMVPADDAEAHFWPHHQPGPARQNRRFEFVRRINVHLRRLGWRIASLRDRSGVGRQSPGKAVLAFVEILRDADGRLVSGVGDEKMAEMMPVERGTT